MIELLYENHYLDDCLNPQKPVMVIKKKQELSRREELNKQYKDFREEKKETGFIEEVSYDFEEQLENIRLNNLNDYSEQMKIIIFVPSKSNQYPFKTKNSSKCFGFLTDSEKVPRNRTVSLFPRKDQVDRMKHYMNNIKNNPFYAEKIVELEANKEDYNNASESELSYDIEVVDYNEMTTEKLVKIKFFHVFMFNIIYCSESSFYNGLFNGDWDFKNLFARSLNAVKKDMINSKIFGDASYYQQRNMESGIYMFTMPIRVKRNDDEESCFKWSIDWELIDSCIQTVNLKIRTFANLSKLLELRTTES